MVVVLPKYKIAYFPMRRVASTTVKNALRGLAETDGEYKATHGNPMSSRERRLAQGNHIFTIVCDPISRVLSCYGDRVIYHQDLTSSAFSRVSLKLSGLNPKPDIDEFCQNIRAYRFLNDKIRRHTRPQIVSLGDDLGFFDKIYRIFELAELAHDLTERTGKPIVFEHLQTGGPKFNFSDLSKTSRQALLNFTAEDYWLLKGFFTPPEA